MKKCYLLLLILPIFACNQSTPTIDVKVKAETTNNIEKKKAIILKNIKAFSQALMNQDYDTVVDAYTDDAKIFPQNSSILTGKTAIRKYWTPPTGSNRKTTYHKITPEEIKILGDEAYDYGYYEGKSIGEDGQESSWGGKYVITWKEVEPDVWKMYLDILN
ncbi:MAG: DUF4440 domain-containing protein [Saprospiraceae bacterium]